MEQRHPARAGKVDRVRGTGHVGGAILLVIQIEAGRRGAVDQQIMLPRYRVELDEREMRLRNIAVHDRVQDRCVAIVTAHIPIAMDQRADPMPARSKPRRNLPTDQSGCAGHKDAQRHHLPGQHGVTDGFVQSYPQA